MYGDDGPWHVRNIRSDEETAAAIAKAQTARSGEEETSAPVADEQAKAVASAVKVPTVLPDAMQQSDELQAHVSEVAEILAGAGYTTAQIQRLADLSGEIALDVPQQPHYDNREESEGILKARWGREYDANVKATREAAHKLGPRYPRLPRQGAREQHRALRDLGGLGRGDLGLGKEAATKEMEKPPPRPRR